MGLFDDVRNAGQAVLGAGQKGLGLVGSGLQALGGAMGGTAGTPGINPAAPDPRQGGLGLAKPTPPLTRGGIENGPQDLSDLPFVTRLVLALDDGFKHNEGMVGEGDRLRMQRQQAAEQRKLAWKQNIEVVDKFRAFLDTVPVTERDSRAAKLRQKYVTEFGGPGSEELFDTIIGAGGDGEGLSTALLHHPKVQLILANNPRASMADIKQAMNEPDFWPTAQKIQDDALLPSAEKKVQSLLNPQSPTLLARAQELGKNGYTIEEIKQLNELAGEGPEGSRLTPGELATLERQQGAIAQRIPAFKTTAEFDTARQKEADMIEFREKEKVKLENQLAIERERASLRPVKQGGSEAPTPTSVLGYASKVDSVRRVYFDTEAKLNSAINSPINGVGDIQALYQFITNQDETAAREGELALAQSAASAAQKIDRIVKNVTEGRVLDDKVRGDIKAVLEEMRTRTKKEHRAYVERTKKTSETLGVPIAAVLPDYDTFVGGEKAPGKVVVSNGTERFEIDEADLEDARADGFEVAE